MTRAKSFIEYMEMGEKIFNKNKFFNENEPTMKDVEELDSLTNELLNCSGRAEKEAVMSKAKKFADRFPDIFDGGNPLSVFSTMSYSKFKNRAKRNI